MVEPQRGGNIGAAARAIKNFGFSRIDLVNPACDPLGEEARRMAVSAVDLLEASTRFASLDEAIADANWVVGTTARRGKQRDPHWPIQRFVDEQLPQCEGELVILFGREDHGLSDQDLDRCSHLIYIPTGDQLASLNVSQAMLLIAWELHRTGAEVAIGGGERATAADREAFFDHFTRALHGIGFVSEQTEESIVRRFRRLFGRADLSVEELATLRGLARQMLWAAGQKDRS